MKVLEITFKLLKIVLKLSQLAIICYLELTSEFRLEEASKLLFYRNVTFIERLLHCLYRFQELSGKLHLGQNYTRNILYSIN